MAVNKIRPLAMRKCGNGHSPCGGSGRFLRPSSATLNVLLRAVALRELGHRQAVIHPVPMKHDVANPRQLLRPVVELSSAGVLVAAVDL